MLTPTVAYPTRETITVDGTVVASGTTSQAEARGRGPLVMTVTVTTDRGATRSYTVVVSGRVDIHYYVKASNTGVVDLFGSAVSLSGDGSTLAVGAYGEDSSATGVDGDQANDDTHDSGAVYVDEIRAP